MIRLFTCRPKTSITISLHCSIGTFSLVFLDTDEKDLSKQKTDRHLHSFSKSYPQGCKQKLWKLIHNVHIQTQKGENFDTELLYWDQNKKRVYSDKAVRVEQVDRIIYAEGFESNEQMTKYTFFKVNNTIFYVDEESTATVPADSLQNDSVQ